MLSSVSYVLQSLRVKIVCDKYTRMLCALSYVNGCVSDARVVKCCSAKCLAGDSIDVNDVSNTRKITNNLKINQLNRHTS